MTCYHCAAYIIDECDEVNGHVYCMTCSEDNEELHCEECGEFRPEDNRVTEGMKCGPCAYGDSHD